MNIRTSAFRRLAILSLSALAFAACDEKDPITQVLPRAEVEVSITPSSATLQVGQTTTFVANVNNDTTGTLAGVNYTSSNNAVATVNAAGVVTAVAPGTTTIIATSKFRNTKAAAAQVTVIGAPASQVNIALAPSAASLTVGSTLNLVSIVTGTTNTGVSYSTSDASVATVSSTGVVTATQKNGTAVITATSQADPTKTATSVITVTGGIVAGQTAITITPPAATIEVGGTFTFVSNVTGNANTAKTFVSSDTSVAKVNATTGVVTATNKAGTTVITAIATGDATKQASATLTVTRPTVVVTASPTTLTIAPQGTSTITSTITGSAADIAAGVTCTSSDTNVATVNSSTCVVTAVNPGTATITVRSVGDNTKTALVTVTVQAQTQPSISIQSVTQQPGGVAIAPNGVVTGNIDVVVNVSAGSASSIQRVAVRLGGVEACTQTFNPPLAPTQGVAQITCTVNTAQLNQQTGAAIFTNGTYLLTADAFSTANSASPVATATFGNVQLLNANNVNGSVRFDNLSVSDADNIPTPTPQIDAAGNVWNGGHVFVAVTPAIFTGTAVSTIDVTLDLNCDGAATAGEPTQNVTLVNGTAEATFLETRNTTVTNPGSDNIEDGAVCFITSNSRAANNTVVAIPANSGRGVLSNGGTGVAGTATPSQAIDNVEPTFAVAPSFSPTFTGASQNSFAGSNTTFSTTSGSLSNVTATDGGVGRVTTEFFAVPAGTVVGTQAQMRTAVTGVTPITNTNTLASTGTSNTALILIVRASDALGNSTFANVGTFGVDNERPTIAVGPGSIATNNTTNNTTQDIIVAVTDTFSGPNSLRARGTIYSVLEVDNDAGTETRCIVDAAGTTAAVPANTGVCPLFTVAPLVNVGGQTENGTIVVPNAAANNDEGLIIFEVTGTDRAGNSSTTTLQYTTLNDVTAPTARIDIITINNLNGTTELTGQIRENVDLLQYDTRFTFPGLASVPDDVPFVTPTVTGAYGLPLVGVVDVNSTASATVRDIRDNTGAIVVATAYGFGATDVAENYSFTGQAITNTAGAGVTGLSGGAFPTDFDASFDARADAPGATNTALIDRSAGTSANLFAQVRTSSTGQNPIRTVYFYVVNPGGDNTFNTADDYNVLLDTRAGSTATVVTGITDRTFTFVTNVDGSEVRRIAPSTQYPMFAIGVAANGSAIMSDVVLLTIQD